MKIYNTTGSKERLFEMMKGVNKVEINESYSSNNVLEMAFKELKANQLEIEPQDSGDENIVNLLGTDRQGNTLSFIFHVEFDENEQDNVFEVSEANLISFAFDDAMGGESLEMNENELQQFNAIHGSEMVEIAGDYVKYNEIQVGQPEEIDELYEDAIKKIDSYPYGGTPERMQTSKAYGDEKPTNDKVRVKAPELNKFEFVDEGIGIQPDTHNTGQRYFDKLNPDFKEMAIRTAKESIDFELVRNGLRPADMPPEQYRAQIKKLAIAHYERHLATINEEDERDKNNYPDQMGKKFKPKNQIPKKRKKPQTVVKLGEQYEEDDDYSGIPDLDIPVDRNAMRVAKSDITKDTAVDSEPETDSDDTYDFVFNENEKMNRSEGENTIRKTIHSLSRRMDFGKLVTAYQELLKMRGDIRNTKEYQAVLASLRDVIAKYFNINDLQVTGEDVQNYFYSNLPQLREGEEEKPEPDVTKNCDELTGGLADDKEPKDFDPEQLAMGLKVEMEHTDDPKLALEIAMDHLVELPDYYTHLDKMETEAGAEGDDDIEMTDRLLGYEPKNVGDEIELNEDLFSTMGDIFRPETGANATGKKKHVVVFDGTSAYVEDANEVSMDVDIKGAFDNIDDAQARADEINGEAGNISEASAGNKTKMFKIGEYAVGGIIKVDIDNKSGVQGGEVAISALDYNTKQPVQGTRFVATNIRGIDDYLHELTSSYYAGKIMEWLKPNLGVSSKPDYFSNQNW